MDKKNQYRVKRRKMAKIALKGQKMLDFQIQIGFNQLKIAENRSCSLKMTQNGLELLRIAYGFNWLKQLEIAKNRLKLLKIAHNRLKLPKIQTQNILNLPKRAQNRLQS